MGDLCSELVGRLDKTWPAMGWVLFVVWFLGPFFTPNRAAGYALYFASGALLLVWWTIDIVNQQVAIWQILVGLVMLGISFAPRGGVLAIACWIIYWTRVRE